MKDSRPTTHPSALALHEHQLGILPPEDRARVAAHLAGCGKCRQEVDSLAADQRRFEQHILPRAAPMARRPSRWLWALASALAASAAAIVLWTRPPEVRPKGDATLTMFAARGDRVIPVEDGVTELAPGDRIRFVVRPGGLGHALVAAVDGAGRVTVYHPFGSARSAPLPAGARVELPGSIVLDRSPGPERVFVLLARRPFPADAARQALSAIAQRGAAGVRQTTRLDLPVDAQGSVLFEKPVAAAP